MTLLPLPISTRAFGGEGVDTYSRRLAARNHTDNKAIEHALHGRGLLPSKAANSPARLQAWRDLGGLHQSVFTTPQESNGGWITDRDLCVRCCQGQSAHGRLPQAGFVCLRHRRWIGVRQRAVDQFPEALSAERHFRNHLSPKGIFFDAFAMQLGLDCSAAGICRAQLSQRSRKTGIEDLKILLYPERVAFARLVSQREFLDVVADRATEHKQRHAVIQSAVRAILPDAANGQAWRAVARIWTISEGLAGLNAQGSRHVGYPADDVYQLLRFSSLWR